MFFERNKFTNIRALTKNHNQKSADDPTLKSFDPVLRVNPDFELKRA